MFLRISILAALLSCLSIHSISQTLVKSTQYGLSDFFSKSNQMIHGIDDNNFLFIHTTGGEDVFEVLNKKHETVFTLKMLESDYFSFVQNIPERDQLLIITRSKFEGIEKAPKFILHAYLYDSKTGQKIADHEVEKAANSTRTVTMSQNRKYFTLWGKKGTEAKVFSAENLQQLGAFESPLLENEYHLEGAIGNNGRSVRVVKPDSDKIRFEFYEPNGTKLKVVELNHVLDRKGGIYNTTFKSDKGAGGYIAHMLKLKGDLSEFHVYKLDFEDTSAKLHILYDLKERESKELMYNQFYPAMNVTEPAKMMEVDQKKPPKKMKQFDFKDFFLTEEGHIIMMIENVYSKGAYVNNRSYRIYSGRDIAMLAFDQLGNPVWGNAVDRWVGTRSLDDYVDHPYVPGFSGVNSRARVFGNRLHLINFENNAMGNYSPVIRVFDLNSGQMVDAGSLFNPEENFYLNINYVDWLNEETVVAITKIGMDGRVNRDNIFMKTIDLTR